MLAQGAESSRFLARLAQLALHLSKRHHQCGQLGLRLTSRLCFTG